MVMERLTKRINGGLVFPNELIGVMMTPSNDTMCQILTRLAAYEDTGLEPEEIEDSIGWMSPVCVQCDGKTSDGIRTEKCGYPDNITKCLEQSKHLSELAQAEQDGRLVVLPCGTDVELVRDGHSFKADHWNHTLTAFRDAPENKSGKQVAFFSIEEAEAALKGGEG